MKEYIEKEKVYLILARVVAMMHPDANLVYNETKDLIMREPNADVVERKHGKWTLNEDHSGTCSVCGRVQYNCYDVDNWDNFCHFCGSDMRG